ncbi:epimerase [Marimonas arenosa]|uniref:Epimerase n=1 Tax=Marimonas arenosa TaxID=1795305 RepID=A0AAE4B4A3_9RHOB|nr:epimerase [Marimonas arenosa]MDQ2090022.1 epimerase [Marimonas arenosa]
MSKTALILGASGKIGTHAARAFAARGWTIRRFNRATDDMTRAAQGCDLIVNGLNPPNYHNWVELIPAITAQVIAAAQASGATVLIPGNVYHFGDTPGEWSETTSPQPCSRKGRIRLDMERSYRASGVQTIVLRAGDFIDPDHQGDIMSLMLLSKIKRGRITAPGPTDRLHTYAYLPDWADAAASLAESRDDLGGFEDIPFPGHAFSLDTLRAELESILNRKLAFSRFPWWLITLASPVWELARELREMRYLWEVPHSLSSRRFDTLLPDFEPTPLREVLAAALPADIHPDQPVTAGAGRNLLV